MERLHGQKVWVVQFDDDDDSLIGIVDKIADGFIALRNDGEPMPSLYVNLTNVKEIELFREEERGRRGHLSVVPLHQRRGASGKYERVELAEVAAQLKEMSEEDGDDEDA